MGRSSKGSRPGRHQSIEGFFARPEMWHPVKPACRTDTDKAANAGPPTRQGQMSSSLLQLLAGRKAEHAGAANMSPKLPEPRKISKAAQEYRCPVCGEAFPSEAEKEDHMAKEFELMEDLDMPSPGPPSGSPEETTPPVAGPSRPNNARGIPPVATGRTFTNSRPSIRRSPFSVKGGFGGGLSGTPGGAERAVTPDIESLMRSAAERAQRELSEKARRAEEERVRNGGQEGAATQDEEREQEPKAQRGTGEEKGEIEKEGQEGGEEKEGGKGKGEGSQEGGEGGKKGVKRNGPEGQKKCFICRCWVPEEEYEVHVSNELNVESDAPLVIPGLAPTKGAVEKLKAKRRRRGPRPENYDRYENVGPVLDDFGMGGTWEGAGAVGMGISIFE
ncbi:hypothetical protein KFL_000050580 [Klebsormidium nitens]|uniref:Uncharacterized protein n=1 Tax=Klebsormidium nitens TaxID=105231 RepID=A0A1Y1HK07_KLENI|nr:hypothetical protein KFL_000050580 [Klebsormidium nitens]|eukprot:GAQ77922.1 hypothetical protein KFL_000050580 [Klebsormidium nitens]